MDTGMTALIVGSCLADLKLCCGDSSFYTYPGECVKRCLHRPNSMMRILTQMLFIVMKVKAP